MIENTKGTAVKWLRKADALARFNERITKDPDGCWVWQGRLNAQGYAAFKIKGQVWLVHRWIYEFHRGVIPKGLVIDHLCGNRCCVNPNHLEAVTIQENNSRARTARTHCFKARHPLTEDNLFVTKSGIQMCRLCREERIKAAQNRSKQFRLGGQVLKPMTGVRTLLVSVLDGDERPLIEALTKLKEQGLILDYR